MGRIVVSVGEGYEGMENENDKNSLYTCMELLKNYNMYMSQQNYKTNKQNKTKPPPHTGPHAPPVGMKLAQKQNCQDPEALPVIVLVTLLLL